ncbi:MAG: DUF1579 family protein [Actinomycetota bacterium]
MANGEEVVVGSIAEQLGRVPRPIEVGQEMAALERFFPERVEWEGMIHENGMGPGTPAMKGVGRGTSRPIQGGRWIAGDYVQEQYLEDGSFVLKWQLHWVSGWSPEHSEYRASMVDNYGHAMVYRGRIEGDRLIFESLEGAAVRLRFTWTVEPGRTLWRNEMAIGDGDWFLIEEYPMIHV